MGSEETGTPTKEADIRIQGTPAEAVKAVGKMARAGQELGREFAGGTEKPTLAALMDDASNIVRCQRLDPTKAKDPETDELRNLVNEVDVPCPTTPRDVQTYIKNNFGGKTWHMQVIGPSGPLGGGQFKVNAPAKLVFEPDQDEEASAGGPPRYPPGYDPNMTFQPGMVGPGMPPGVMGPGMQPAMVATPYGYRVMGNPYAMGAPGSPWGGAFTQQDAAKARAEEQRLQMELEEQREQIEERRRRREQNDGRFQTIESSLTALRERIEAIQRDTKSNFDIDMRRLKEDLDKANERAEEAEDEAKEMRHTLEKELSKIQGSIDKVSNDLLRQLDALKSDVTRVSMDPNAKGQFTEVLNLMQKGQSEAIGSLQKMVVDVLAQKVSGESQVDQMNSMVQTIGTLASIMGFGGGNAGPKTSAEILADTVDKALPHITSWMQMRQDSGEKTAKEVIGQKIDEVLGREIPGIKAEIAGAAKAMIQQRISTMVPGPGAPAAGQPRPAPRPAAAAPPAPRPPAPTAPAPTATAPAAPPAAAPAPPAAPAVAPTAAPTAAQPLDLEGIKRSLVNQMLSLMKQEAATRPDPAGWVQFALDHFPNDLLERFAAATDPKKIEALLGEYGDPSLLVDLAKHLVVDEAARTWVQKTTQDMLQVLRGEPPEVATEPAPPAAPAPDAAGKGAGGGA